MGCDMHAHIEVKLNGVWQHYSAPIVERFYGLFNLVAFVRPEDTENVGINYCVCKHFGFPEDASDLTKYCYELDASKGRHHAGYLTARELEELQEELYLHYPHVKRTGIDRLDLDYNIFRTYINGNSIAYHSGFEDSRLVFWFDN